MAYTTELLFDKLFGVMIRDIMPNPIMIVLFTLFFFTVFGVALRLTSEILILVLFFVMSIILSSILIWLGYAFMIFVGLILGLLIYYFFGK